MAEQKRKRSNIAPEDFVKMWESSESLAEVVAKSGIPTSSAAARASLYRKKGINLKHFKKGRKMIPINVDELNALVAKIGGGKTQTTPRAKPTAAKKNQD